MSAEKPVEDVDSNTVVPKAPVVFPIVHSEEEAYAMYCKYGHDTGFSVRKQHIYYYTHTRKIKVREYSCSKAGVRDVKRSPTKYRKAETRTGCQAFISFSVDVDGKNWTVSRFVEEHNHPLATEAEKHLLRSNRKISQMHGNLMKNMTGAGIKPVDAFTFLSNEAGGAENIGFCKSDAFNFVQRERRALIESGDSSSLLRILQNKHVDDNMFSYDVRTDEFNRLTSFFWMDGRSKIDYDCFGDVIIFDTTYRLNKYNLVCAPFVAVNNHWQNIFVGGAFIAEETIDSFRWVFETFLKFVGGRQPTTIFTDQDAAMSAAIQQVFTNSRHRLCQWHISKKAPSKVPCFNQDTSVRSFFYQCMSKCDSEEEFERNWTEMMTKGNLSDNKWLAELYLIRKKWSTAFNKDLLDLGILSTQRSESTNNRLHGSSKGTSSLVECFMGMETLISTWRVAEHTEDFRCKHGSIGSRYKNCGTMLRHLAKLYTPKIFSFFEKTFMEGAVGVIIVDENRYDDGNILFVVKLNDGRDHEKRWFVSFNCTTSDATCSCRGFETKGLLCQHILRVYNIRNVQQIPLKYVLKRFSITAKKGIYLHNTPTLTEPTSNMIFRNHLMRFSYDLATRIEHCKLAKEHVLNAMNDLSKKTDDMLERDEMQKKSFFDGNAPSVRDPAVKRPKGAPTARMKDHWDRGRQKSVKKISDKKKSSTKESTQRPKEYNFVNVISDEESPVNREFNFFTGQSSQSNTPPAFQTSQAHFEDLSDDFGLDLSFNFSSIPDVFKP